MEQHNARRRQFLCRALITAIGVWTLAAAVEAGPRSRPGLRHNGQPPSGFVFSPRFRPNGPLPAPGGPGNVLEPFLPSGVTQTFPLTPFQQPDILRNYLQMRATSPRPNTFMGGQFNAQYRSAGYPAIGYDVPYYGGYDPYYPPVDPGYGVGAYGYGSTGGFSYGGYVSGPVNGISTLPSVYSGYGGWYPQSLAPNRVVVQREVIYVKPEARSEAREAAPPQPASGDYYLIRPKSETLNDAIGEIQKAWLNGDHARLMSRVRGEGKVRIYLKGKYQYSVDSKDFGQMTRDAMDRIDTTDFELDRLENLGGNRAFASGKHSYIDPDKSKREVYVSYGLIREDGRWKIAEAGSATAPIKQHEE